MYCKQNRRSWSIGFGAGMLCAVLALFGAAARAEGPAVSAVNGKADIVQGGFDGDHGRIGLGSLSLPAGRHLGLQLDGAYGNVSGDQYNGVGGHFFWRDPDKGLVGGIASYQVLDHISLIRYGAEAELYTVPDFIFAVRGGYQAGDVDHGIFLSGSAKWFPSNNAMLELGGEYAAGDSIIRFGAEYQLNVEALPGLSVYSEAAFGSHHYDRWLFGVRYYFGVRRGLRDRSRYDDPDTLLPDGTHIMQSRLARGRASGSVCSGYDDYDDDYNGYSGDYPE